MKTTYIKICILQIYKTIYIRQIYIYIHTHTHTHTHIYYKVDIYYIYVVGNPLLFKEQEDEVFRKQENRRNWQKSKKVSDFLSFYVLSTKLT